MSRGLIYFCAQTEYGAQLDGNIELINLEKFELSVCIDLIKANFTKQNPEQSIKSVVIKNIIRLD